MGWDANRSPRWPLTPAAGHKRYGNLFLHSDHHPVIQLSFSNQSRHSSFTRSTTEMAWAGDVGQVETKVQLKYVWLRWLDINNN